MRRSYSALIQTVLVAVMLLIATLVYKAVGPQRYAQFFERDPSLSHYRLDGEIVDGSMLLAITASISLATIALNGAYSIITAEPRNHVIRKMFFALFGLALSCLCSELIGTYLKMNVGRPRPNAYFRCNYLGYQTAVLSGNFTSYDSIAVFGKVGNVANCQFSSQSAISWSSFPSGHATLSFATMVYSTLVLFQMLPAWKQELLTLQYLPCFIPVSLAIWISVSRIMDFSHFVEDVLAGILIGSLSAVLAWSTQQSLSEKFVGLSQTCNENNGGGPFPGEVQRLNVQEA